MSTLVINAGSTSLKFGLFGVGAQTALVSGSIDWADGNRKNALLSIAESNRATERLRVAVPDDWAAARCALQAAGSRGEISAIGHRVVYGGTEFGSSARVEERVKAVIRSFCEIAPLHNPPALAAIEAGEEVLPGAPQVAVFDTGFFQHLPIRSRMYGLPFEWHQQYGAGRIGFHGISNGYCLGRAAEMLGLRPDGFRLVTCHLGGGCSATAVQQGQPVATTMGFTPLEGLIMGTRCGSVDPGLLLHLQRRCGLSLDALEHALTYRSGLLGLSGVSADLAQIEAAAQAGNERARLAFEVFADRVRSTIGGLAVTMGGLDALVFTDRMGEGSPALRAAVCQGLECLGAYLDPAANSACQPDARIATAESSVRILVIHTREELMIARETQRVIGG